MKVSREQAALNRGRIVDTAARLFREKGYDGIGVADLMKGAGLTHGGFYGHFGSKQDLLAEACAHALGGSLEHWHKLAASSPSAAWAAIRSAYLSPEHRDHPELGCAITALGGDVARAGPAARHALTEGANAQLALLEALMAGADPAERRRQALAAYAGMIGAVLLARAVDDTALSGEILAAVAAQLAPTDQ